MSNTTPLKNIHSDLRAIKIQLEALMHESQLYQFDTLAFLLDMACREATLGPSRPESAPMNQEASMRLQ